MVITISREYGSGGRFVGRRISEVLGIPFYDREIILVAAEKSGLSPEFIENADEKKPSSILFDLAPTVYGTGTTARYDPPPSDRAFFAQAEAIRDFASRGDCVIVGRCADYILAESTPLLRVFIHAKREDRVDRIVKFYGFDEKNAEERLIRIDKKRAAYRRFYTGETWNVVSYFDLTINMSLFDIDSAVGVIQLAYNSLEKKNT